MIRSCPQIFTGSKRTNQSYKKNLMTVTKLLPLLNAVIHNRSTTFIHLSYIYRLLSTIRSKAREKGTKHSHLVRFFPSASFPSRQTAESFWIFRSIHSTGNALDAYRRTCQVQNSAHTVISGSPSITAFGSRAASGTAATAVVTSSIAHVSRELYRARTCNSHLRMARVSDGRAYERTGH